MLAPASGTGEEPATEQPGQNAVAPDGPPAVEFDDSVDQSLQETAVDMAPAVMASIPRRTPRIRVTQRCNLGRVRSRNEDSTYIFHAESGGEEPLVPFGLYIVADGMGGHHAGHEASRHVCRFVAEETLRRTYLPLLHGGATNPETPQEPIREVMLEAVQAANKRIHSPDPARDSGTTLTAAILFGQRLYLAHVGDSRAYLFTEGELTQVTTDHSYVRRLQDSGQITEEEAALHPQRNMLYKAVGQGGELEIDTSAQTLPDTGKFILCSDGMWGLVSNNVIQDILDSEAPISEMAEKLVDLALEGGGHDNISVIIVDFNF